MAEITVMKTENEQEVKTEAMQEQAVSQPLPVAPVTPVPSYVEDLVEEEKDQEREADDEPKFLSL